ncbi:hypothetical protein HmCmsJML030_02937 [Escherichia coli]|nr:hypothetical protein HmCmsJML030_02937 [Escherichia coli]
MAFSAAYPAHLRQHNGDRFRRQHVVLAHRFRFFAFLQRRTTFVTVGLRVCLQFFLQQVIHFTLGSQNALQLVALFFQLTLLTANLHLFQFGKMTQFQFEDRFRLGFRKAKPRHQRRFRFIFITNDLNHFVDIEKRHQQTFEDMQALEDLLQAIVQTAAYGITTEHQPFREDFPQIFHRRTPIQTDHIEVNTIALFQIGGGEEVIHHLLHIHAIGTRHDHQTGRVLVVRFIAQIVNHRQLLVAHLRSNLLQHARARNLMR